MPRRPRYSKAKTTGEPFGHIAVLNLLRVQHKALHGFDTSCAKSGALVPGVGRTDPKTAVARLKATEAAGETRLVRLRCWLEERMP
jgi:hypothetical protein